MDSYFQTGWFGRPYDGIHLLSYLAVLRHKTIVELDEQLLLSFTDLKLLDVSDAELVFKDFGQCVFDWQEYGSLTPHLDVYPSGTVTLVRQLG